MFLITSKIKKLVAVLFIALGLLMFGVASADSCSDLAKQFQITVNGNSVNTIGGLPQVCTAGALINSAITIIMALSATVAVVFLMLGGFWFVTSAGNDEQAEKGRKTLTSAIIGLVVIIMSFAIVRITTNFLMSNVSGDTPPSSSTGTGGGNSGGNSGSNTPPGGNSGGSQTYVSTDPNSIFYNIPQSSVDNYKNGGSQQDYLQSSVASPTFKSNNQGLTVSSSVSASDTSSIVEMAAWCSGSTSAVLNVYDNNSSIGSATFQKSGGNWVANVDVSSQLQAGDSITYGVCGHPVSGATATVPSGPR